MRRKISSGSSEIAKKEEGTDTREVQLSPFAPEIVPLSPWKILLISAILSRDEYSKKEQKEERG